MTHHSRTRRWLAISLFASLHTVAGCHDESAAATPVASQSNAKSEDCTHSLARDADDWIWSDRGDRFAAYPKRGDAQGVPGCVARIQAVLADPTFQDREDPNAYVLVCAESHEPSASVTLYYHSMEVHRPSRPYLENVEANLQRFTTMRILNLGALPVWVRSNVGYASAAQVETSLPVRWQNGRKILRVRDASLDSTPWAAEAGVEVAGLAGSTDALQVDVELRQTSFPAFEEYDFYATILELSATSTFERSGGILIRSQELIL